MKQQNFRRPQFPTGQLIVGAIFLIVFFLSLFWLARGVFSILSWLAPFLFIGALLVNYKVVIAYGKWLLDSLRKNVLRGILYGVLTVVAFPIVAAYLLFKAVTVRKLERIAEEMERRDPQGNPIVDVEYEIVDEETLQLPEKDELGRYKELFRED